MLTEEILSLLQGVRQTGPRQWTARCPAHEDDLPSLSVAAGEDGKTLVKCFTGCTIEAIASALRRQVQDFFPDSDKARSPRPNAQPKPKPPDFTKQAKELHAALTPELAAELAAELGLPIHAIEQLGLVGYSPTGFHKDRRDQPCWVFPECDDLGHVVGLVCRYRDGKKMAMDGHHRGVTIGPNWTNRTDAVYLPEGPSDVAACAALGLSALGRPSNQGGIDYLASLLKGMTRDIVVVAEYDRKPDGTWPGQAGGIRTAQQLADRLGRPVAWALPPDGAKDIREWAKLQNLPTAGEAVADEWIAAGERFQQAIAHQSNILDPSTAPAAEQPPDQDDFPTIGVGQLLIGYPMLRPPIIEGLLRQGETMNVIAPSKVGKSWLIHDLALAVATGTRWIDTFPTMQGRVLLIDNELHKETLAYRLRRVAETRGLTIPPDDHRITVIPLRGQLRDLPGLADRLRQIPPATYSIVIIDAWYRVLPRDTDENDNGAMAALYNTIDAYADLLQAANTLIHHASKGDQSGKSVTDVGSGAGAQSRAADTHLILRPHAEDSVYVLDGTTRSFPPFEKRCLRWAFPQWRFEPGLDPADLRRPQHRTKKEKPAKETWDATRFVATFIPPEGRYKTLVVADATAAGLSENAARKLYQEVIDRKLAFQWQQDGYGRMLVATTPPN